MKKKQPQEQPKPETVEIVTSRSGIIVETEAPDKRELRVRLSFPLLGMYVLLVAAVIAVVVVVFNRRDHDKQVAVATQRQLVQSVSNANAVGDMSKLGRDSDRLIAGAANGTYTLTDKQLAQAYANRGDVTFNAGDEKSAIADYERAVKLDGSQQVLVGDNEFVARYHQGERGSLVPLLQTLAKPLQNDHEQGAQQLYSRYESYITDLQAGKELEL